MPDWKPSPYQNEWSNCRNCGHFRGNHCRAYPKGIPLIIMDGQVDHHVVRPGQVGDTVFTPLDVEVFRATGKRVPAPAPQATQAR